MIRRAIVLAMTAAFLLVIGIGCGGSEPNPSLKSGDAATLKKPAADSGGNKPAPD